MLLSGLLLVVLSVRAFQEAGYQKKMYNFRCSVLASKHKNERWVGNSETVILHPSVTKS